MATARPWCLWYVNSSSVTNAPSLQVSNVLCRRHRLRRTCVCVLPKAAVEQSTTVSLTLMYAAHCSLWTRRGYGTCDDMKQYSTVQRTSDISAAAPSHQPTRYGRETEQWDAIPNIRSLSVIPFDASDGLIPRYRQKYQARHRFYTSCLNWVFLVSYKNPVLLPAVDWTLHTGGKANHKNIRIHCLFDIERYC